MMKHLRALIIAASALASLATFTLNSHAGPPPQANTAQPALGTAGASGDKVLWDFWYTVTVNQSRHYGYYNDRVEIKSGKVFFKNKFWKQEEGYINEEQLGAFAAYTTKLTPMFYNFHSTFRTTETKIDGNVYPGNQFKVKTVKGSTDLPVVKKSIPENAIFSVFFPVWLGFRLPTMQPGTPLTFSTILEDNIELNFAVVEGKVRMDPPDATAKRTKTTRLTVDYRDMKSIWYVDKKGAPYRIEMPDQKTVVQRANPETAQKFLDE